MPDEATEPSGPSLAQSATTVAAALATFASGADAAESDLLQMQPADFEQLQALQIKLSRLLEFWSHQTKDLVEREERVAQLLADCPDSQTPASCAMQTPTSVEPTESYAVESDEISGQPSQHAPVPPPYRPLPVGRSQQPPQQPQPQMKGQAMAPLQLSSPPGPSRTAGSGRKQQLQGQQKCISTRSTSAPPERSGRMNVATIGLPAAADTTPRSSRMLQIVGGMSARAGSELPRLRSAVPVPTTISSHLPPSSIGGPPRPLSPPARAFPKMPVMPLMCPAPGPWPQQPVVLLGNEVLDKAYKAPPLLMDKDAPGKSEAQGPPSPLRLSSRRAQAGGPSRTRRPRTSRSRSPSPTVVLQSLASPLPSADTHRDARSSSPASHRSASPAVATRSLLPTKPGPRPGDADHWLQAGWKNAGWKQ